MKNNLFLIAILGLLISCNPEDLDVSHSDPKFMLNLEVDGETKLIEAGNDQFYLEPGFEVVNDVLVFHATFQKDESCTELCQEKLSIKINDFQLYEDQGFDVRNSIEVGRYKYLDPNLLSASNLFLQCINTSQSNGPFASNWTVSGFDVQAIFSNIISVELPDFVQDLSIGLNIEGPGCKSGVMKTYSGNDVEASCDASIKIIDTTGIQAAYIEARGEGPFEIEWHNNINEVSGLVILNDNSDVLSASVTAANGCRVDLSLNLNKMVSPNCLADFNYNFLEPASAVAELSTVIIEYTDKAGEKYSTELYNQTDESFFEILEIVDYLNDEKGNPTKEMKVEFDAVLSDEIGNSKHFKSTESIIAISYPTN